MRIVVTRGEVEESEHQIHAVVSNLQGPVASWGDADRSVIPRSAIKSIQAIPLLRTGAADRFDVSETELALACASHSGELAHVEAVRSWLGRIGLGEAALECGPSEPIGEELRALPPAPILNCCSGKHAGFLTVARHLGVDPAGYVEPDHPVQRLVTEAIEQFTGCDLSSQAPGRDGCDIPTFAIPLTGLAGAMARVVGAAAGDIQPSIAELLGPETAAAAARLVAALPGREFWVSGTGRHEVSVAAAASEPLIIKAGAEGVYMAGIPGRGLGIAIKAADGTSRAAEVGISAVLAWLGVIPAQSVGRDVTNFSATVVGRVDARDTDPDQNI